MGAKLILFFNKQTNFLNLFIFFKKQPKFKHKKD
jgi:hypothetical protein